ncbi:MAG: hypothetical protein EBY30_03315 [Rhodospirillales bacterium]|nr:hypothetical protein [Rhodospirillales bacterium]
MVPRVGILGLHLEANAFAPPTLEADFRAQCWEEGAEITRLARAETSHLPAEMAGFYRRMDETGAWAPKPIAIWAAPPGGPIDQALFLRMLDAARSGLLAAMPLDAVYVASHGASSATGQTQSARAISPARLAAAVSPAIWPGLSCRKRSSRLSLTWPALPWPAGLNCPGRAKPSRPAAKTTTGKGRPNAASAKKAPPAVAQATGPESARFATRSSASTTSTSTAHFSPRKMAAMTGTLPSRA